MQPAAITSTAAPQTAGISQRFFFFFGLRSCLYGSSFPTVSALE